MLIQNVRKEPAGTELFLPAGYDVVWSALALVLLAGFVAAVVLVARALARTGPRVPRLHDLVAADPVRRAARRHGVTVSALAVGAATLVGIVTAQSVAGVDGLAEGVLTGLTPAIVGAAFLGTHAVGELTWPRQRTAVRAATLQARSVRDVTPRGLRLLTWALGGLVLALVVIGGLTAGADGRSVTRVRVDGWSTAGPYPGWFYGAWLALAAVVLVAGSEGVLRLVARRPAVPRVASAWDLALRRTSAHRVLRGVQLALAVTAAGTLGVGANAAARAGYAGAASLVAVAVALALAGLWVAVQPAPDPDEDGTGSPAPVVAGARADA